MSTVNAFIFEFIKHALSSRLRYCVFSFLIGLAIIANRIFEFSEQLNLLIQPVEGLVHLMVLVSFVLLLMNGCFSFEAWSAKRLNDRKINQAKEKDIKILRGLPGVARDVLYNSVEYTRVPDIVYHKIYSSSEEDMRRHNEGVDALYKANIVDYIGPGKWGAFSSGSQGRYRIKSSVWEIIARNSSIFSSD